MYIPNSLGIDAVPIYRSNARLRLAMRFIAATRLSCIYAPSVGVPVLSLALSIDLYSKRFIFYLVPSDVLVSLLPPNARR